MLFLFFLRNYLIACRGLNPEGGACIHQTAKLPGENPTAISLYDGVKVMFFGLSIRFLHLDFSSYPALVYSDSLRFHWFTEYDPEDPQSPCGDDPRHGNGLCDGSLNIPDCGKTCRDIAPTLHQVCLPPLVFCLHYYFTQVLDVFDAGRGHKSFS